MWCRVDVRVLGFAKFDDGRLLSHGFDTNAPLIGEKHENLVGWIIISGREEVELVPTAKRGRATLVSISLSERTGVKRTQ